MTDIDLILRNQADLLTAVAIIMENNEMEEQAKVLYERANDTIGHLNRKQKEAIAPSKFITDAINDMSKRPWPDDLRPACKPAGKGENS